MLPHSPSFYRLTITTKGVDFYRVGGARAQQIRRRPSGDLDPRGLLRLQSQVGRAGGEFGELGHPRLGGNGHPWVFP